MSDITAIVRRSSHKVAAQRILTTNQSGRAWFRLNYGDILASCNRGTAGHPLPDTVTITPYPSLSNSDKNVKKAVSIEVREQFDRLNAEHREDSLRILHGYAKSKTMKKSNENVSLSPGGTGG